MSNLDASDLVDSGSSHCFIEPTYICDHNIEVFPVSHIFQLEST